MLKKLKVSNYKSLRDVEIEFGKFNVLIGKNGSGKSNILNCLEFLSKIAESGIGNTTKMEDYVYKRIVFGGIEEKDIKISLEFDNGYYLILFDEKVEKLSEKLSINGKNLIDREYKDDKWLQDIYIDVKGVAQRYTAPEFCLFSLYNNLFRSGKDFADYVKSWRVYRFITQEIRAMLPVERAIRLEDNGKNLAQVLHSLLTERPRAFKRIEETLKLLIPEIEELLTPLGTCTIKNESRTCTYTAVREKGFDVSFDYRQISDGSLKLLAFITAVNLGSELICIEEPENFVHPYLLSSIVEILKKSDKQVIVSTHSPYLLDKVDLEDLIVVEKEEGATRTRKIKEEKEKERIKALLNDGIPLGEAYVSGAI